MGAQAPGVTLLKHRTVTTLRMIVCIPGARRCYQRAWRVDLGCWIYVHNLRDCAKMDEMLRALLFAPHTSHLTPHTTSSVGPSLTIPHASSASHYPLRVSHSLPHTTHFERRPVATNDCSGKYAVFSGTQSSGPWASMDLGPL